MPRLLDPTVARITARSLLGRRRALLLVALPAVLLVLAVLTRALTGPDLSLGVTLLGGLGLGTLVPLLALLAGTGAIAPEIDDGSILYVLATPVPRASVVVTKLAVAVAVVTVLGALPVWVAGVVLTATLGGPALAYAVGALVAGVAYCALFVLLGVVSRNAVVVGLLYALVWESLVGSFVPGAQALSIQQWALAVTERVLGRSSAEALGVQAAVGWVGVPLLVVVVVVCTAYAARRLRSLRLAEQA